jgi:hypothetical protein
VAHVEGDGSQVTAVGNGTKIFVFGDDITEP